MPPPPPQCILAQFGCHQYCPLRTGQASFTQKRVSPQGIPQSPAPTHACFIHSLTYFSLVAPANLATLAKGGLREEGPSQGPSLPDRIPLTIPHAGSLMPGVFVQVIIIIFFVMALFILSVCLAFPSPQFLNHFKAS